MAGMKGRSGGARENSGGVRAGAGRPKNAVPKIDVSQVTDPQVFLLAAMNDTDADARLRIDAAKALMPFMHLKPGEGKKATAQEKAKAAGKGVFSPGAAPKLALIPKA